MPSALRALAILVIGVVITSSVVPCPPLLVGQDSDGAVELSMRAKCPCSCSDGTAPSGSSTHLDVGIEGGAPCDALAFASTSDLPEHDDHPVAPPFFARDHVPI